MNTFTNNTPNKKVLNYSSSFSYKIKPILTLTVLIALCLASYHFGLKNGLDSVSSVQVVDSDVQAEPVMDSNEVVADKTVAVVKKLGVFNNEEYFLESNETWPVDKDGNLIKKNFAPSSYSTSILKKISMDGKEITVGENIKLSNEYASVEGVSGITSDYSSIFLNLNCVSCENSFVVINLASGRAMSGLDLINSMKVRSKLTDCSMLLPDNFIQDNLLFICNGQDSAEILYKYHLTTYAPSEIEVLKEGETFSCAVGQADNFLTSYEIKTDELFVNVCSKNPEGVPDALEKSLRDIKVKDI